VSRIGLVARADNTGLGTQSWEFHRHMKPAKTLIVDFTHTSASGKDLTVYADRFPGNTTIVTGPPDTDTLIDFLDGLDSVFTMETPYNFALYPLARQRGIQTVLQANWEMLGYHHEADQLPFPDVLAFPSTWNLTHARKMFSERTEVIHLPVPIPTDRFDDVKMPLTASRFLHVAGYPALGDRNGTRDLLAALPHIRAEVVVSMTCQRPGYLAGLITANVSPPNVILVIETVVHDDYWGLYEGHHALILPRRYGGLCLPVNEALGAGMPVLMPAVSPNSRWLPSDWLTPAQQVDTIYTKVPIDVHRSDPIALAARIDRLATDENFYGSACRAARDLADTHSWTSLLPRYQEVLA